MNDLLDMAEANLDIFSIRLQLFIILPTIILLSCYVLLLYYRMQTIVSYFKIIIFICLTIIILSSILWITVLIEAHDILAYMHYSYPKLFVLYLLADIVCAVPFLAIVSLVGMLISKYIVVKYTPLVFIISMVLISLLIILTWTYLREEYGWKGPGQSQLASIEQPAGSVSKPKPTVSNWVSSNYSIQESHPPGTRGNIMVYILDFRFYIDKYEVTNQEYRECISAKVCAENKKFDGFASPKQPVVGVNQNDAKTYCQWVGKRLPMEQEWKEAAQGIDSRQYPWGNWEPGCNLANYGACKIGKTLPVGSKPAGASPYGALDMAGNVWEWVEEKGAIRGGSLNDSAAYLRVSNRVRINPTYRDPSFGFRCAWDGS